MAGQRPEWTFLLFRRRRIRHLCEELPLKDQTLVYVDTLSDLADLAVCKLRDT